MKVEKRKIMIVEDDVNLRDTLSSFLTRLGYEIVAAHDGREALEIVDREPPDLILSDINMPDIDGLTLLADVKKRYPDIVVVMMTAFSSIDSAVEAMRRGAEDYLSKPLQLADVQMRVERALERRALHARLNHLENEMRSRYNFDQVIGRSPAMQRVFKIIERVAPTNSTVLISGRTGTGKELVARAIHYNSSRATKPFVDINCGALPEQLVESELFGHQKGAFTNASETKKGLFETAHGGTLFLDEVQALKLELQAKLLRALQERVIRRVGGRENIEVDVRIIAATNQDILEATRRGEFREDLYYRLNVINISLPELRERHEDIPLLIDFFLKRYAQENNLPVCQFNNEAMRVLLNYEWPGNVRELQNAVEHAIAIGLSSILTVDDLPAHIIRQAGRPAHKGVTAVGTACTLEEVEHQHILKVLEELDGNHTRAAEVLGIDRRTLYRKLEKYQIAINHKDPEATE